MTASPPTTTSTHKPPLAGRQCLILAGALCIIWFSFGVEVKVVREENKKVHGRMEDVHRAVIAKPFPEPTDTLPALANTSNNINESTNASLPLWMIFCGGKSGYADMEAILNTWGRWVDRAVILSNTPEDLPLGTLQSEHPDNTWKVENTTVMDGGPNRDGVTFWKATIDILYKYLQQSPNLQWVMRSDSDTWWNVRHVYKKLLGENMLPSNEPLIMGEFYPLHDGRWAKGQKWDTPVKPTRSNGLTAYLSGGAGAILTRAAVETLYHCFHKPNFEPSWRYSTREDMVLSSLVHACNVTLVDAPRGCMRHRVSAGWAPRAGVLNYISIHRANGDGRGGFVHPNKHESELAKRLANPEMYDYPGMVKKFGPLP